MSDFDDRLASALGRLAEVPMAEPEAVDTLHKRARVHRLRRVLAGTTAIVVAVAGLTGVLVATRSGNDDPNDVQLLAPNVLLGDIDAVVLSSKFDENGARAPIPSAVRDQLAQIPGVEEASGIVQRFTPMVHGTTENAPRPPRTPILFSYHEPSEISLVSGALPNGPDQIVVNHELAERLGLAPGDEVALNRDAADVADVMAAGDPAESSATPRSPSLGRPVPGQDPTRISTRIVSGIFEIPGADTTGMPLAAVPATQPLEDGTFDRVDLALAPGADLATVQAAAAAALAADYVLLTPTELGLEDQRTAELDIQHAYWALLSSDPEERFAAREPDGTTLEQANDGYEEYKDTADQAELRIQRVSFLAPDRATLVYRVYYGGSPSPIINVPQSGEAVLIDGQWRIAASTTCQLATYVAQQCAAFASQPLRPPDGWNAAETEPQLADAFRTLADPDATIEARMAAVANSDVNRAQVEAGLASDRAYSGKVRFLLIGVRVDGDRAEVLYSLATDVPDGPSTPYPVTGSAQRVGDRWVAGEQYACGITGLAIQGCYTEPVDSEGVPLEG